MSKVVYRMTSIDREKLMKSSFDLTEMAIHIASKNVN